MAQLHEPARVGPGRAFHQLEGPTRDRVVKCSWEYAGQELLPQVQDLVKLPVTADPARFDLAKIIRHR